MNNADIAVLIAAYFVTRFLGHRTIQTVSSKYMKIVDRIFIGNDKSICLVQIGEHFYLIGITNHHIECIAELNEKDLVPIQQKQFTFSGLLSKYMKNHENANKGRGHQYTDKIEVEDLEK